MAALDFLLPVLFIDSIIESVTRLSLFCVRPRKGTGLVKVSACRDGFSRLELCRATLDAQLEKVAALHFLSGKLHGLL
jgi:hypothetical protein